MLAPPAEALILDGAPFRSGADQRGIAGAVGLAEGVAAGNQSDRLLVVHRHAEERFANVLRRRDRVWIAVRLRKLAFAAVALIAEPCPLGTPEQLFRLPDIGAAAGKTEGFEAHRLQRAVAGKDHQVRPRNLVAVF